MRAKKRTVTRSRDVTMSGPKSDTSSVQTVKYKKTVSKGDKLKTKSVGYTDLGGGVYAKEKKKVKGNQFFTGSKTKGADKPVKNKIISEKKAKRKMARQDKKRGISKGTPNIPSGNYDIKK